MIVHRVLGRVVRQVEVMFIHKCLVMFIREEIHVDAGRDYYQPVESEEGPLLADLALEPVTHMLFEDGNADVVRDHWSEGMKKTKEPWTGAT